LQALADGCAVYALDTVFNREMLADGRCGMFFSKAAGDLKALIQDMEKQEERLDALRLKAPQQVRENYTWEKITAQYIRLFEDLVK